MLLFSRETGEVGRAGGFGSMFRKTQPSPGATTAQICLSQHPSSPGAWLQDGSVLCLEKTLKSCTYFSHKLFLSLSTVTLESSDSAGAYERREELSNCPKTLIGAAENMHYSQPETYHFLQFEMF